MPRFKLSNKIQNDNYAFGGSYLTRLLTPLNAVPVEQFRDDEHTNEQLAWAPLRLQNRLCVTNLFFSHHEAERTKHVYLYLSTEAAVAIVLVGFQLQASILTPDCLIPPALVAATLLHKTESSAEQIYPNP